MRSSQDSMKGFTLVELSIVLVIIGLIVGGILVGQDMIKAAEIRATVAQVEKFNTAVNTFRTKYGSMPGDAISSQATAFGLFSETTLAGSAGHQDGNGMIEGGSSGATVGIGETLAFWRHLSDASLLEASLGAAGNSAIVPTTGLLTANVTNISQSLPAAKTSPVVYYIVYSESGFNYYQLLSVSQITAATGALTLGGTGLSPIQAYNIDNKTDDGLPNSGTIVGRGIAAVNAAPSVNAVSTANICTIGTGIATDTYNRVASTGGTDASCSVRFRFN